MYRGRGCRNSDALGAYQGFVQRHVVDARPRLQQLPDCGLLLGVAERRRHIVDAERSQRRIEPDAPFGHGDADQRAEQALAHRVQFDAMGYVAHAIDDAPVLHDEQTGGADALRVGARLRQPVRRPSCLLRGDAGPVDSGNVVLHCRRGGPCERQAQRQTTQRYQPARPMTGGHCTLLRRRIAEPAWPSVECLQAAWKPHPVPESGPVPCRPGGHVAWRGDAATGGRQRACAVYRPAPANRSASPRQRCVTKTAMRHRGSDASPGQRCVTKTAMRHRGSDASTIWRRAI